MEYNINSIGVQYNSFINYNQPYYNFIALNNNNNTPKQQHFNANATQSDPLSLGPSVANPSMTRRLCHHHNYQHSTAMPTTLSATSASNRSLNFSIDSILNNNESNTSGKIANNSETIPIFRQEINSCDTNNQDMLYNWLHCTRYKPPKVKKRSNSMTKRKPLNRGPRIPFTSCQISALEEKFRDTHYLSSLEVTQLADKLNLTESRIRIWFQNRRAREKREEREDYDRGLVASHMTNVDNNYLMQSLDKRNTAPTAQQSARNGEPNLAAFATNEDDLSLQ